jgi:hypothetical protein
MPFRLRTALLAAALFAATSNAQPRAAIAADATVTSPLKVVSRDGTGLALVMHVRADSTKAGFALVVQAATRYLGAKPTFYGGGGNPDGSTGFTNFRVTLRGVAMLGIVGVQREKNYVLGLVVYDRATRFKTSGPHLMKAASGSPSA